MARARFRTRQGDWLADHAARGRARGKRGEDLAVEWLEQRGFDVLQRNLRRRQAGEVDLLACKAGVLHIIEVKTGGGSLEQLIERVDERKVRRLLQTLACSGWLEGGRGGGACVVDLLLVQLGEGGPRLQLVEDVCPPEIQWRGGADLAGGPHV